jgi:RHS repeat-associated protein
MAAPNTVRHTYAYDAAGFLTSRDGVTLGYDATGAIASIGTAAAFDHDLDGRPVSRTLNGVTKNFRFGGAIAYSPSGSPIEMDLGEVVIRLDGTGNRFRHTDFRGNVLFVSKGNGTVEGCATYGGFGSYAVSGQLGERGFAGGFEIPSLGLVVLGPRVLDSDTGRFLSQDPVFNAVNLYAYAQGNPVIFWDPTGRDPTRGVYSTAQIAGFALGGVVASIIIGTAAPYFVVGLAAEAAIVFMIGDATSDLTVLATAGVWHAFDANAGSPQLGDFGAIGQLTAAWTSSSSDLGGVSAAANVANDFGSAVDAVLGAREVRSLEISVTDPVTGASITLGSDPAIGGGSWTSGVTFSFSGMY